MEYIERANLPDGKIKYAIIDFRAEDIKKGLSALGINVISTKYIENVDPAICGHGDVQIFHIGNGNFLSCREAADYYTSRLDGAKITPISKHLGNNYPSDCLLNAVMSGEYIILNKNAAAKEVLNLNKQIIHVNQGYSKCSVCVVAENAFITSDAGIYNSCKKEKIDIFLTNDKSVVLDGYDYGFIGGATGKLDKSTLGVCGNAMLLKDYDNIRAFCLNHGVYIESLSNCRPKDIGSIIPIAYAWH